MKTKLFTLFTIATSALLVASAYAATGDYTQDAQELLVIENTNLIASGEIAAGLDFEFQGSKNVAITGQSSATSFAHTGYHTQTENKANGRQFAMAADISVILWMNISDDGGGQDPLVAVAATTSAVFPDNVWNTL